MQVVSTEYLEMHAVTGDWVMVTPWFLSDFEAVFPNLLRVQL